MDVEKVDRLDGLDSDSSRVAHQPADSIMREVSDKHPEEISELVRPLRPPDNAPHVQLEAKPRRLERESDLLSLISTFRLTLGYKPMLRTVVALLKHVSQGGRIPGLKARIHSLLTEFSRRSACCREAVKDGVLLSPWDPPCQAREVGTAGRKVCRLCIF